MRTVSPSGFVLSVSALEIWSVVWRARDEGVEPVKVLCPFRIDGTLVPIGGIVQEKCFGVRSATTLTMQT
jgi:hypothetical protein